MQQQMVGMYDVEVAGSSPKYRHRACALRHLRREPAEGMQRLLALTMDSDALRQVEWKERQAGGTPPLFGVAATGRTQSDGHAQRL
ncbi:unannotated protein [freshwater metagenome]|uniref:Unannotated protein n=1 Tax=freshwater metagenome TaxID=449393 RepID=A0A6J7FXP7_9ZZZZ